MKSTNLAYGSTAKTIHWISALLIFILFGTGFFSGSNDSQALKTLALQVHVPVASLVLILTIVRLVWWWKFDRKPAPLDTVPDWQNKAAKLVHKLLYLLLFVLLGSGITMSIISGLPLALFGDAALPIFDDLPPRTAHGLAARLAIAVVLFHAVAALHHHLIVKDNTLKRMWFSAKKQ